MNWIVYGEVGSGVRVLQSAEILEEDAVENFCDAYPAADTSTIKAAIIRMLPKGSKAVELIKAET